MSSKRLIPKKTNVKTNPNSVLDLLDIIATLFFGCIVFLSYDFLNTFLKKYLTLSKKRLTIAIRKAKAPAIICKIKVKTPPSR